MVTLHGHVMLVSEDLWPFRFKRTGKRNEIFIATKAGFVKDGANNTSQYLRSQLENSLKLMGTDHIDLFYVHVRRLYTL